MARTEDPQVEHPEGLSRRFALRAAALAPLAVGAGVVKSVVSAAPSAAALGTFSVINAKGDLMVGTDNDIVDRLPVGPDGFVLTARSSTASGLTWAPLSDTALTLTDVQTVTGVKTFTSRQVLNGGIRMNQSGTPSAPINARIVHFQSSDPARGPFSWDINAGYQGGTVNRTMALGYNVDRDVPAEPSLYLNFETDFNESGFHWSECYFEYFPPGSPTSIRPMFFGFGRDTGELIRTIHFAGTNGFQIKRWDTNEDIAQFTDGQAQILGDSETNLIVRSGRDTNAHLYLQRGTSNALAIHTVNDNQASITVGAGKTVLALAWFPVTGTQVAVGAPTVNAAFTARSEIPAVPTVSVQPGPNQTAPVLNVADTSGILRSGFDKGCYVFTRKSAAPADADIVPGEVKLWFDPTEGAAKLMVKGKSANGTVVSGSIPLK